MIDEESGEAARKHVLRSTAWNMEHPEKRREYNKKYRKNNKKKIAEKTRKWQKDNPEKVVANNRRWCKANPEKAAAKSKRWKDKNKIKMMEYNKNYRRSIIGKIAGITMQAKRRGLGHIALNSYFEDAEGHHITHDFIMFVPKWLHRSMYHNLNTRKNILKLNALALDFLLEGF